MKLSMRLNALMPSRIDVARGVDEEVAEIYTKHKEVAKGSSFREGAFVSRFITPAIHRFLSEWPDFGAASATNAIVSENSIDRKRGYAHQSKRTKHPLRQPFTKSIGISAAKVVDRWYESGKPLSSKHPDLCIDQPFRVVFEAKYIREKSINGRNELVNSIYEAFFYRGLAPINQDGQLWDYDYAVALVYDGTERGDLVCAWNDLDETQRSGTRQMSSLCRCVAVATK